MQRYVIASVIAAIITSLVFALAQRGARTAELAMDEDDFVVRMPKASLTVYIVITIFFLFIFAILLASDGWGLALYTLPFVLFGPFLIVLWCRWKIVVRGNQIVSTSYFGKTKSFTFDYITLVKCGVRRLSYGEAEYMTAYHEKKRLFDLTAICPGFRVLRSRLEREGVHIKSKG